VVLKDDGGVFEGIRADRSPSLVNIVLEVPSIDSQMRKEGKKRGYKRGSPRKGLRIMITTCVDREPLVAIFKNVWKSQKASEP